MSRFPDVDEVDRVAGLSDPVVRNLQITQCYHELSAAVAERTGANANWCTFATWASKQAGQSIRREDLARALEGLLVGLPSITQAASEVAAAARHMGIRQPQSQLIDWIWRALDPESAIERASAAVARGNQKVFAEIGREFARFAGGCLADPQPDPEHIEAFCAALRPGDPPEGQQLLQQAFRHYYRALFAAEPQARAELMLLANLEIGLHEQTRLQPEIAAALETSLVGPQQFARRLLGLAFPRAGLAVYGFWLLRRVLGRPTLLELAIGRLLDAARRDLRRLITDHLMVLGLPGGVRLRLGDDLRARFPDVLARLTLPELLALLNQVDPTPDSLRESGALDWGDLPDRIHFIADLFRCYAAAGELFEAPFTAEQVSVLKHGSLPQGPL